MFAGPAGGAEGEGIGEAGREVSFCLVGGSRNERGRVVGGMNRGLGSRRVGLELHSWSWPWVLNIGDLDSTA